MLGQILETARVLAPAVPFVGVVGAGCAVLALRRSIVADAARAATDRATLVAQVAGLVERVADDRAAAQRRGGHVAAELAGVRLGLEKLGEQFAERGARLTAIEHDHDGLAGRVEKVERECFQRHVGPAGPRGLPGFTGAAGADGAAGHDGADGHDGARGEVGPRGRDGGVTT